MTQQIIPLTRVVVVALTRQYPGEAIVIVKGQHNKAMANQIMAIDQSRLKNRLAILGSIDMLAVEDAIKVHLALPR